MPVERRLAAFIDRDGVINRELNHVHRIEDFHLLPGVDRGLARLAGCGYELVIVTNQAGIAKGLYSEAAYMTLTRQFVAMLANLGVHLAGVYHCPHHPEGIVPAFAISCDCRKPAPGLLLRAARDLGLDLAGSVIVGDKLSDIEAGRAAGVGLAVLVASGHPLPSGAADEADYCCEDLEAAARWICGRPT